MVDPALASDQELQIWKKEKHVGSPASILFLTKEQLQLWREKFVVLLADYSTGAEFESYVMIKFSSQERQPC